MKATHNCINKVRKDLIEANNFINCKIDLANIQNISERDGIVKTAQKINYSYNHKKKNGDIVVKEGVSFVTHEYCPFCGEKYELDK